MIHNVLRTTMTAALAGFFIILQPISSSVSAETTEFSKDQREAIGGIVRQYLMENPGILRDMMAALETKEAAELAKAQTDAVGSRADDIFRSADDIVLGNPKGDVTLVEFFDYNCGYCKRALKDLQTLIKEDKNLRVVMKEYPILSEGSAEAARVSLAMAKQGKYMEFHAALMNSRGQANEAKALRISEDLGADMKRLKADMADPAIMNSLKTQVQLARSLNLRGTPAYIIDDIVVPGAVGVAKLRSHIKTVRAKGCKFC